MTLLPVFKGIARPDGTLVLRESDRDRRREWVRALARGRGATVDLILRHEPEQRSLDQNRYLHAVPFRMLHDYTGHTIEEIKRLCLAAKFGSVGLDERGWPVPVIAHTSSLDVAESSALIEFIPPWALELTDGRVSVPLPKEVEWRL